MQVLHSTLTPKERARVWSRAGGSRDALHGPGTEEILSKRERERKREHAVSESDTHGIGIAAASSTTTSSA